MTPAEPWDSLRSLVGTWTGGGSGEFPTLESFEYRERLDVAEMDGFLHYVQRTWRVVDGHERQSHIETGFVSIAGTGRVELLCAEGSDRVEVLTGDLDLLGDAVRLEVRSVAGAHDPRVLSSWRRLEWEDDGLRYEMGMSTTAVPDGSTHLTARLRRS
jgi:hypothetical protein